MTARERPAQAPPPPRAPARPLRRRPHPAAAAAAPAPLRQPATVGRRHGARGQRGAAHPVRSPSALPYSVHSGIPRPKRLLTPAFIPGEGTTPLLLIPESRERRRRPTQVSHANTHVERALAQEARSRPLPRVAAVRLPARRPDTAA